MKYSCELKNTCGDVAQVLNDFIKKGAVGKEELKRLAAVLKLIPTYDGFKNKDTFDDTVAIGLLSELLDKEDVTHYHLF